MTTNMFLEVASVVCYGVHLAVTSFSSSLACKVASRVNFVAILFEILRCSCLLGRSGQLSFGIATLRICITGSTVPVLTWMKSARPHPVVLVLACSLPEAFQCCREMSPLRVLVRRSPSLLVANASVDGSDASRIGTP